MTARAVSKETPVLLDGLLLHVAGQGADELAQMGGFIRAHGYGVDAREVIGGPEGRLQAGEAVAVAEEDAWVDPAPHRGAGAASKGTHPPHLTATQVPRLGEGIGRIQRFGSDKQTGVDQEDRWPRRGRVHRASASCRGTPSRCVVQRGSSDVA
ncbi:hypothetical protein TPA0910_29800 [Streptomyces hygroscopicus subsp. sporocinereus]|uniref:Uncharacterized protein n=1 Tax=Streptomyces hygroscopicus TaxID=1912 RepID=A0ABQ3TYU7_STRHY|nr:hypothetical protein TPA0910_29800 [Streptomyces hygroscopicus]